MNLPSNWLSHYIFLMKNIQTVFDEKIMISPFVLRRLKSDVLKELPEKLEEVRYVRFEGAQQRLYDAQATKIRAMLEKSSDEDMNRRRIQILAELTRIRQICCDPSLLFEDYQAASAKREACLDLIRSAMDGGHRILVFSQFTSMLALLEKDLNDAGIEWFTITGETPKQDRMDLVRRFSEGTIPVFLISLKAGGTGLNLTGADTVIHYDPWWNVAAQNQATDRAHRIGQTRTVCVYKLIGKDTVEEKILKLQQDKQDLADEILSGEGRSLSAMSREELMALLG
ncbi:MAG: DEAD/DEAH box helicase [Clostridia bacterium]|nr:DEAD/DEAH box helicase [Clostridia bacterium]